MAKKKQTKDGGLSDRALLVAINISQWSARKVDKKATETVIVAHKASNIAGKYNKKLLPGALELDEVNACVSKIRKFFHDQTLPWMSDGSRILASQNYINFSNAMTKMRQEFNSAVGSFVAAYPVLKVSASKALGDLYDAEEYPDDINAKFAIEVSYLPLPHVKDFRTDISEGEKKAFIRKMKEVELASNMECWNRLHGVVKAAAEKLAKPDSIFRDSLLENISEMVKLLPMLNVNNDPNLERSRKEVEKLLGGISADDIRKNQGERDKAQKKLSEIEAKMGAFMGVK